MTDPSLQQRLIALEKRLFEANARLSREQLDELLADDFIEFPSTAVPFDKAHALKRLPGETPPHIEAWDFRVRQLAPTLAQITYQARLRRPGSDQVMESLRSSLWRLEDGQWRMCFHQGTVRP
ncbi:nuclear transport factor 2 family protein [Gallaecimonas sp. GXIMD4217]|uniref:nuclear transport factor 2 family protein n=1 Tax=Gallaecimonas sp. GXIMD4217 TaxID=3131927 RepID=UPI00311B2113